MKDIFNGDETLSDMRACTINSPHTISSLTSSPLPQRRPLSLSPALFHHASSLVVQAQAPGVLMQTPLITSSMIPPPPTILSQAPPNAILLPSLPHMLLQPAPPAPQPPPGPMFTMVPTPGMFAPAWGPPPQQ